MAPASVDDGAARSEDLGAVHLAEGVGDQLDTSAVGVAEVDRHLAVDDVLDALRSEAAAG